jgi:hypothetical protein
MESMVITLPSHVYQSLQQQAEKAGKALDTFAATLITSALQEASAPREPEKEAVRQVFQATGRLRPLSARLREKIIPGVTLEDVQASLSRAGGESLSDLILAQRGRHE